MPVCAAAYQKKSETPDFTTIFVMTMRKRLLITLLLGAVLNTMGQEKWTLKRAVEYALQNNISVKQADIESRLANLTLNQSRLAKLPNLNVSNSSGVNFGRSIDPTTNQFTTTQLLSTSFTLSSGVTVFNFFSLKHNLEGNRFLSEASKANIERVKNDVAINVATSYILVLVAQEQERIANVAIEQSLQNIDNTSKRVEAGALPELNLAEIETQLAIDSTTLITAQQSVQTNLLQLKAILNLDASTPFELEIPGLNEIPTVPLGQLDPEYVYTVAVVNLPQQKMNDLRIKANESFVKAARGQMYPTISACGGMGSQYSSAEFPRPGQPVSTGQFQQTPAKVTVNGVDYFVNTPIINTPIFAYRDPFGLQISDNFRQNLGFQVNIPIFNNGQARTQWQRSKLFVSQSELQKDQDLILLKQNIYSAYNDARAALQKFNAGMKRVETAEKAYNFAQKRYELGLLSSIDLLTNQNNLTRSRLELAQAHVDYIFRLKLLEFYKGEGITLQ